MKTVKADTKKEFLKKLPRKTGVYLFKNKRGEIVYVGRAANLRTRVSSYFVFVSVGSQIPNRRPAEMFAGEVEKISFEEAGNLLEAAILENNFIKKYRPKYNIKDNDDRSFAYVFFDMSLDFPRPVMVRARTLSKYRMAGNSSLAGPFKSQSELKNILSVARQIFPYSTCRSGVGKPCFHRQIGLCPGVCAGEIEPKEYKKTIRKLIKFLKSQNLETGKKSINDIALLPGGHTYGREGEERIEAYDISYFKKDRAYGAMAVFMNESPSKKDYRLFRIKEAKIGDDAGAIKEILARRLKHREWDFPDLIIVDGGKQQVNAAKGILEKTGTNITLIGISKAGKHAQSSAEGHELVFEAKIKKANKEMLSARKLLFQKATAEAHRFAIKNARKVK